jgi:hypothetical protein
MRLINEINRIKELMNIIAENDNLKTNSSYTTKIFCKAFTDKKHKSICEAFQNILKPSLKGGKKLDNLVNKIIQTYNNEIEDSEIKRANFKDSFVTFYEERIKELDDFIEAIDEDCPKVKKKLKIQKEKLEKEGIKGLIFHIDEKPEYSFFNRLNTNYSALSIILTKYVIDNFNIDLIDLSSREKIGEFIDANIRHSEDLKKFIKNFIFNDSDKEIEKFRNSVIYTMASTRVTGLKVERSFANLLDSHGVKYLSTLDDYSFVDMAGFDFLVKFPKYGYYVPVQIKTSWESDIPRPLKEVCDENCNGIFVYKSGKNFKFKTCHDSTERDIDELFI